MKRLCGLVLVGLLVLGVFSAPAGADDTVKVWTQNLYLGADLTPVITAPEGGFEDAAKKALEDMAANLFPLRAQRLATEVALNQPDLIALQEVEAISLNDGFPGPPFVDYLQALLNALALRGQNYEVAAVLINLDLTVPINLNGDTQDELVRVVDRDVILVRKGVTYNVLNFGCASQSQSEDGCTYSNLAEVKDTPLGTIYIKRGFVGIEATVRGKRVFFVTTHLEEREPLPGDPEAAFYQFAQATELAGTLHALADLVPGVPLILSGDFNSSPQDELVTVPFPPYEITPPYQIFTSAKYGFTDSWTKNPLALLDPKGYTCCQNAELDNRRSLLNERIDIIFIRGGKFLPWEFVTTKVPLITPAPHWASDHGGVFAKLIFR